MSLAHSKIYPLDHRFSVELALEGGRLDARWSPHVPKGRKARSLAPSYREARAEFIGSLGVPAMVIEI